MKINPVPISLEYKTRVFKMLRNMKPGDTIHISDICKPDNTGMFQHAVQLFIVGESDGKTICFVDDEFMSIKKKHPFEPIDQRKREQNRKMAEMKIRRNEIIEWWETRLEKPITPFQLNSAEYVSTPKRTIRAAIDRAHNARPGTHVFNAWVSRLESLKIAIQK